MFGSFIMLALGFLTNLPNSTRSSSIFCSEVRKSEKLEIILPESEMSRVSILIFACSVNDLIIGNKE